MKWNIHGERPPMSFLHAVIFLPALFVFAGAPSFHRQKIQILRQQIEGTKGEKDSLMYKHYRAAPITFVFVCNLPRRLENQAGLSSTVCRSGLGICQDRQCKAATS